MLDIPIWLDKLICRLLEKKPEDRPFNASKVAEALGKVKEKWESQQSAGLDAAKKRRADRSKTDVAMDETDKETALTLLGKKKKKKSAPFYTRGWFTVISVAAVLAGLAWLVWFFFIKPPSADVLYAQAEKTMKSKDLNERCQARDGPLAEFLRYYPEHSKAEKIRKWKDQVDCQECELQLKNRDKQGMAADESEKTYRLAVKDVKIGNLAAARTKWLSLLKLKDSPDAEMRPIALVAEKYLKDIADAETAYSDVALTYDRAQEKKTPSFSSRAEKWLSWRSKAKSNRPRRTGNKCCGIGVSWKTPPPMKTTFAIGTSWP